MMLRLAMALAITLAFTACKPATGPQRAGLVAASPSAPLQLGPPLRYAFTTIEGERLGSANMKGRMTIIAFAATFDTASQAQARYLKSLIRRHAPRINVMLVVLEGPNHLPLVQAFASSLALPFPVAMADEATIAGKGPFRGLHHVPSIVLLDREGRERWRKLGLVSEVALSEQLRAYE